MLNYQWILIKNMRSKTIIISILIFLGVYSINLRAQTVYGFDEAWNVSAYVGSSNFHGDLSDNTNSFMNNTPFSKYFYQDRRMGVGIYVDKMFTNVFGVRGILMYSSMKSTKESVKKYFTGDVYEYSLAAYVDLTNLFLGHDRHRLWDVYTFVGIGYSETRALAYNMKTGDVIGSTGYRIVKPGRGPQRMTEVVIPAGLGVKYKFTKSANVFVEFTRHFVHTNKLDAYPVEGTTFESLGLISLGLSYDFTLPAHWHTQRNPRYNGKSPDPSIRAYNKKNHVVMKTKAYKRAKKMRRRYGRKRFRHHRW